MSSRDPEPPVAQDPQTPAPQPWSLRFWIALLLVAAGSGLGGGLLMRLLYLIQTVAWHERGSDLYGAIVAASPERKLICLALSATLVALGITALRFYKGGHAGELVAAIWFSDGALPPVRTLGRAVLSIVVVALGAAVGREGALKQCGAVVGWQTAHRFGLSAQQRRILAACGAGAGMAAAYNIPLAGAIFTLEVLLGSLSGALAVPALVCCVLGTSISWLLLPMRATYSTPAYILTPQLILWAMAAGPVLGAFAAGYVRLIGWADRHKPGSPGERIRSPLLVFAALAVGGIWWPELIGNGKDVVQVAFDGGGRDPHMAGATIIFGLALARAAATGLCLKSGTPGGLFTPTLTCGALLGSALGRAWAQFVPGDSPGTFAVVGAAALLAAATEGPLFSVVAVLELGQHISGLIAPILIATGGACIVMRMSRCHSIYTVRLKH